MFGAGGCVGSLAKRRHFEVSDPAALLLWRPQGTGDRGLHLSRHGARTHFRAELLPPGLAAARAPSPRFSSRVSSFGPGTRKGTRARATPAVSSASFPALEATLPAPTPQCPAWSSPPTPSAPVEGGSKVCPPLPAVHGQTVGRAAIAEGRQRGLGLASSPAPPFDFPPPSGMPP